MRHRSLLPHSTALNQPQASVRRYSGEHQAHAHGHAQILFALQGRMELEVAGRASFVDTASGMIIPAGTDHGYLAAPHTQILVIDAPMAQGLHKLRRFAVPAQMRSGGESAAVQGDALSAASQLALALQAPSLLQRRSLDLQQLQQRVQATLHESWPTARLAQMAHLSVAQFHARFVDLTGCTPQHWLRDLRLDAASCLLRQGAALEATALRCGYASGSALAYALRRERGTSARQLRSLR